MTESDIVATNEIFRVRKRSQKAKLMYLCVGYMFYGYICIHLGVSERAVYESCAHMAWLF